MEPLDRSLLPGESFTIQDMSNLIKFEDIKIEPDFPDPSCTLQEPIVKEESDAPKRNDNSIANIPSSEKQRTSTMEPSDRSLLLDKSFPIQDMSDLIKFEDIKKELDFPDLSCTLQDPIVKEESDASKRNDNSIANISSSEKQRTSEGQSRGDYQELLELSCLYLGGRPPRGFKFSKPGAIQDARFMFRAIYSLKILLFKEQFKLTSREETGLRDFGLFVILCYVKYWFTATSAISAPQNDLKFTQDLMHYAEVNPKIKIECEDLGIWKGEPTDSNSSEFIHAEPTKAINEQEMKNRIVNTPTADDNSLHNPGEKPYECGICTRMYARKRNLRRHIQMHTEEKPYECSVCGKAFTAKWSWRMHMLIHADENPYECSVCGKTFAQKSTMKTHILIHTGEKPYECSVCGKAFKQKTHVKRHMLIHTGEKPYECSVCGKAFKQQTHVKRHMLTHAGQKSHECSVCRKAFARNSELNSHMLLHTGQKPFECSVCGKVFAWKTNMKSHMLIHTGEKPYECSVCGKAFKQRTHVKRHMLTHAGLKTHECNVCRKAFARNTDLNTHMLIHTDEKPYACSVCGKAFAQKSKMKIHILIHTAEKSYECSVCGKAFKQKTYVKQHMLTHTGQRTHKCSVCKKIFARKTDLNTHYVDSHIRKAV